MRKRRNLHKWNQFSRGSERETEREGEGQQAEAATTLVSDGE